MIPNFTIIDREISAYLICVIVGIFVSGIVTLKSVDKEKENDLLDILLWSAPGAFLGGHLLYGLTNLQYLIRLSGNEFNIVTLINMFASAGLNSHQVTNDDLRIILDNFLNGGQTTTFGTVIG